MRQSHFELALGDDDRDTLARCRRVPADRRARGWFLGSLAAHALALGMLMLSPPSGGALDLDLDRSSPRYVRVSLPATARPEAPQPRTLDAESVQDEGPVSTTTTPVEPGARGEAGSTTRRSRRAPAIRAELTTPSASLEVLRARLEIESGGVQSPYANAEGVALDGPSLAHTEGGGLGMQGVGRGTGRAPLDTLANAWGMGGLGVSCTEEIVRPSGVVVPASCDGQTSNLAMRGRGRSTARPLAMRRSQLVSICGDGPPARCEAIVQGRLSRDAIRRVVARHRAEIAYCYEQALASRPDLRGRVTTRWVIAPDGRVTVSSVDPGASDLHAAPVEACIAGAVRRWSFPESDGITAVTYPFLLDSSE